MTELFSQLIDDAIGEIVRREPDYFRRFPLTFPALAGHADSYRGHPQFQKFSPTEIQVGLAAGVDYVAEQCGDVQVNSQDEDPVGRLMLDSIMDAFAADWRALGLRPNIQTPRPLARILSDDYDERRTSEGRRYFVRSIGARPLVLISACGIPLGIWSSFLGDHAHDFKIIVVESRTTDAIAGGMPHYADLTVDGADIVTALDCEQVGKAAAVGWCNGGRTAIDIAARHPDRFSSLTLLSPTLRGMAGVAPQPSPFEDTMGEIFETLREQPQLCEYFASTIHERPKTVNWDAIGGDPTRRAAALLGLPAREYSKTLLAPMLQPDFLVNYGRRVACDESYPINEALARLKLPILVLTGDHDTIVNSAFTCAALATWGPPMTHANVKGGGHYLQDLQYPYFISILSEFLSDRQPAASARVTIGSIAAGGG